MSKEYISGLSKRISGNPNKRTIDEPNDAAKNNPNALLYVRTVNTPIVKAEINQRLKLFYFFFKFNH